jgi:hypothetical protein
MQVQGPYTEDKGEDLRSPHKQGCRGQSPLPEREAGKPGGLAFLALSLFSKRAAGPPDEL